MRIALDTNILAYAAGLNDSARKQVAAELVRKLPQDNVFIPVQAMAELFYVLVTKAALPGTEAKAIILKWCDQYPLIETSQSVLLAAIELSSQHNLRIWDAIMMATSASAECRLLISEDMHNGFTWNGVTVVNPFSKKPHELLTQAMGL